jgi:hypothetical protein|tara:strand:- start:65 stop:394 length:330 start_codon:yes stop_codon:yes gene_type:complete
MSASCLAGCSCRIAANGCNPPKSASIHVAATQHWVGKAPSLSNGKWLKRALGAAQKRDRSIVADGGGVAEDGLDDLGFEVGRKGGFLDLLDLARCDQLSPIGEGLQVIC